MPNQMLSMNVTFKNRCPRVVKEVFIRWFSPNSFSISENLNDKLCLLAYRLLELSSNNYPRLERLKDIFFGDSINFLHLADK
ncbi:MAG: hypothetical protein FD155_2662 [Bacteroidetes bacterium]|nr:MAG: hypothetical protein FD155_2662 [Bacteroidota bacterium]